MNKTITINPDLLLSSKSTNCRTRKSKSYLEGNTIRVKSQTVPKNTRSVKRSILKFIRNHQEKNYKKIMGMGGGGDSKEESIPIQDVIDGGDFDESVKYLTELTKEEEYNKRVHTLKNRNFTHDIIKNNNYTTAETNIDDERYIPPPVPTYGCLKNGNLPTYRQYSKTLKQFPTPIITGSNYYKTSSETPVKLPVRPSSSPLPYAYTSPPVINGSIKEGGYNKGTGAVNRTSEILQLKNKLSRVRNNSNIPKIKTTRRRTFNIGKSRSRQKVSVLISNKTLRNKISTDAQLLKQTSIQDVKRFLVKRGFIRVGTTTGDDVLREMYESINMICGEIKNHNPDTLLYNFHNDMDILK